MDRIVIDVSKPRRGRLSSPSRLRERLTALIGEARERARRRRLRIAAGLFVTSLAVLSVGLGGIFNNGGGGTTPERQPSIPTRATAAAGPVANGPLTLLANLHGPYDDEQVAAVGVFGATGAVFHCSAMKGCYELTGFAWSPNGRWLAIGADTVSTPGEYNGLHLYNLATERDIHLATGHFAQLSWSRDGSKLAYVTGALIARSYIYVYDVTQPAPAELLET